LVPHPIGGGDYYCTGVQKPARILIESKDGKKRRSFKKYMTVRQEPELRRWK
jgi:hypothetical protein